jgi:hypothetical protein
LRLPPLLRFETPIVDGRGDDSFGDVEATPTPNDLGTML